MNFYFSHCESDRLLAKAAKCRLLAEATAADPAARFLAGLADEFEMKANAIEGGSVERATSAARQGF